MELIIEGGGGGGCVWEKVCHGRGAFFFLSFFSLSFFLLVEKEDDAKMTSQEGIWNSISHKSKF